MHDTIGAKLSSVLRPAASRRHALQALTGIGVAGIAKLTGQSPARAKRRKKKCGKPASCAGKEENDICGKNGRCFRGDCVARPTCLGNNERCTDNAECCTNACHPAYFHCVESLPGEPCFTNLDCLEGTCSGYRCIQT